ncbi:Rv2732c family membrane protein [Amycolatopsis thermoflava]|uniref:Rv2732c family membrane protein n=1 Tax=Amycolatopsis thermoflava TaxID=84480 RepID=UPI003F49E946
MSESDYDRLGTDADEVVTKASRTVELGRRGFVIAVLVFVLLVGQLLPWVGPHVGWQVLLGQGGGIPQLFAVTSTVIGVLASALTLMTRRWWLSWVCAMGGWFASVDGLLAIWSQQSSVANGATGRGPGIGMVIALVAIILLAAQWMRTAWSRT